MTSTVNGNGEAAAKPESSQLNGARQGNATAVSKQNCGPPKNVRINNRHKGIKRRLSESSFGNLKHYLTVFITDLTDKLIFHQF